MTAKGKGGQSPTALRERAQFEASRLDRETAHMKGGALAREVALEGMDWNPIVDAVVAMVNGASIMGVDDAQIRREVPGLGKANAFQLDELERRLSVHGIRRIRVAHATSAEGKSYWRAAPPWEGATGDPL